MTSAPQVRLVDQHTGTIAGADIDALKRKLADSEAERENVFPLLAAAHEANAKLAREFAHMASERDRLEDTVAELDDENAGLRCRVEELEAELVEARSEADRERFMNDSLVKGMANSCQGRQS